MALFSRLRLVATDEFAFLMEHRRLEPSPILPLIRNYWPVLIVGALIPLASFALFHLVTVFPISWITLFTQRSAGEFLMVQCSGAFICAGAIVASGSSPTRSAADAAPARAGLIAVFAIGSTIAPLIVEENAIGQTIYVNAGFALLGLSYGQSSGAVTSQARSALPLYRRGPNNDLAWLLGAGFAPLIVFSCRPVTGSPASACTCCPEQSRPSRAQTLALGNPAGLNRRDIELPVSMRTRLARRERRWTME